MRVPEILVLCPQERDRTAVADAALTEAYAVRFVGPDLDAVEDFDPAAFLRDCEGVPADGVMATKDQSALLASILAGRRDLPGTPPDALLRCQHKPTSRAIQREVAPASTPRFELLNASLPFGPPAFAKPVVGRLSQNVVRIDRVEDLERLEEPEAYVRRYEAIASLAGAPRGRGRGFLVEELLTGDEVTLEGYVHRGRVTTIGVTDSVKYPGTISFERFEYPTVLPEEREAELAEIAARIVLAHEHDDTFFNVEFFVGDSGPPQVIEVNGRLASQFAPLVRSLHGRSTYDAAFALATGADPRWEQTRPDGVGVSYVVRVFEDAFVQAVPDPEPDLEILARPGLRLSEQGVNDADSFRLAILYASGETREEALARVRERAALLRLRFRLAPQPPR